jgi:hypothetical protein
MGVRHNARQLVFLDLPEQNGHHQSRYWYGPTGKYRKVDEHGPLVGFTIPAAGRCSAARRYGFRTGLATIGALVFPGTGSGLIHRMLLVVWCSRKYIEIARRASLDATDAAFGPKFATAVDKYLEPQSRLV